MMTMTRAALMVSAALVLGSCGGGDKAKTDETHAASQTVTVATAALTSQPRIVTASGSVTAWEEVPVGAETGGLVATALIGAVMAAKGAALTGAFGSAAMVGAVLCLASALSAWTLIPAKS